MDEKRCHLRVHSCCCCCPIGICSTSAILFFVLLECGASIVAREWINAFLQLCLFSVIIVVLCALRENERGRLVMYQAYAFVLLLNLIEIVAMSVVYFGVFDVIKELCEELQEDPPETELFKFKTIATCEYNITMMLIAILCTGSLTYFPMKVHFMLVLRSLWKEKRDFNDTLAIQELQRKANLKDKARN